MNQGACFVHTADWQLGLRAHHVPGDDGAVVRDARFTVVERIARVAREAKASFVLVAGDVFEDHGLGRETLQRAFTALRAFQCPVFLLPGNHDPYTPDAVYRTEWWQRECPPGVTVLGRPKPLDLGPVTLLPCPLLERHTTDPTAWLSDRAGPPQTLRVGIAHGAVRELLVAKADPEDIQNDIPAALAARARLDYLALGDWHSYLRVNDRTYYSGTPEPTRFKESDPGHVLVVEIPEPRAEARVQQVSVANHTWRKVERTLTKAEDLEALESELNAIPDRSNTLVEVIAHGSLDISLYEGLRTELFQRLTGSFRHLRLRDEDLKVRLSDRDVEDLPRDGWVGTVVQRLRNGLPDASAEDCHAALHQLHRMHTQLRTRGGIR